MYPHSLLARLLLVALVMSGCTPQSPGPTGQPDFADAESPQDRLRSVDAAGITTLRPAVDSPSGRDVRELMRAKPGELLVRFKPGIRASQVDQLLSKQSAQSARAFSSVPGLRLVKLASPSARDPALAAFRAAPEVQYAEPNYIQVLQAVPNDPQFPGQWSLRNTGQMGTPAGVDIGAVGAWDVTTGSSSVVVAVIDSGIDYGHEDLAANIFRNVAECTPNGLDDDANGFVDDCHGIDAANHDADPMDDDGHGTMVAGVIGAVGNNGIGVAGVAWNVKLLPCKFADNTGSGTTADAIACLDYVAAMKDRGVNIVATNNSWGNALSSQALLEAIDAQFQRGILFVAPAGNGFENNDIFPQFPCTYYKPNVLCVASIRPLGILSTFSGHGNVTVLLGAPGEDIPTTTPGNGYADFSGTSAAVPHVVGGIALLRAQNPARDWRSLKNLILAGTNHGAPQTGAGNLLNIDNSMHCTNAVFNTRQRPVYSYPISRAIGDPLELSVLHINCGAPAGEVTLDIQPGGELVTLRDNGVGADAAAGDGIYTAAWIPTTAGTFTIAFPNNDNVPVNVDAFLKPGFPQKTLNLPGSYAGGRSIHAVVGNIDANPDLEILATGTSVGPVYAWHADGSPVSGWPVSEGWLGTAGYPVLGQYDPASPAFEVFIAYFSNTDASSAIYYGNGSPFPSWPKPLGGLGGTVMTSDLDFDGIDEVMIGGTLHVDGSPFNPDLSPFPAGETSSIADIDGDEDLEVVTSSGPSGISQGISVTAMHHTGASVSGFPRYYLPATTNHYPLIGDVDGDGSAEIVVTTQDGYPWDTTVRILGADGAEERQIFVPVGGGNWGVNVSLGDLDGDGFPEIVVHGAMVYVFKGDGSSLPGWPVASGNFGPGNSTPLIGDVTGDGFPDVVAMTNPYGVSIWDRHGVPVPGFSWSNELLGSRGGGAIADLDLDGRNDIVLKGEYWSGVSGTYDSLWVLDLRGPAAHGPIEWGQYKGNAQHTGAYETGKNLPNHAYLAAHVLGTGTVTAAGGGISCGTDCIERYAKGTVVTLTATPSGGASFVRWRGACVGGNTSCTVAVSRFRSVLAEFSNSRRLTVALAGSGSGTVTSNTGNIACPGNCFGNFTPGASVTLTATPAQNSEFVGWSGACSGTSASCVVSMDDSKTATATFRGLRRLTVTTSGNGAGAVTSQPTGISCGTSCSALFELDSGVSLSATPAAGSVFAGWSGACGGTTASCELTMGADQSATARFALAYVLTVTRAGTGTGTVVSDSAGIDCGNDCSESFISGSTVTLTATAGPSSAFSGWSGACSGVSPTCVVTMNAAKTATASFRAERRLTVSRAGTGAGAVVSQPGGISCGNTCSATFTPGASTTLTATPVAGSIFSGWGGACAGPGATCELTMSEDRTVIASFSQLHVLTVTRAGTGTGTVVGDLPGIACGSDCSEAYATSSTVTLTATADSTSTFTGWTGACAGLAACRVTMDAARSVEARFEPRRELTVARTGTGSGTVTSNPAGIDCGTDCSETLDANAIVSLTATASAGSTFDGWTGGGCAAQTNPCNVTMNAAQAVSAAFRANPPPAQAPSGSSSGGGGGGGGAIDGSALAALALLAGMAGLRRRVAVRARPAGS